MDVLIHNDQPLERWREGVMTRMRMSALLDDTGKRARADGGLSAVVSDWRPPGVGAHVDARWL
jgi:hypothetical protein